MVKQQRLMVMVLGEEKSQKLAIILAVVGAITPISGVHKFYLRQYRWGVVYLLLSVLLTPPSIDEHWTLPYFGIAQVACLIEGVWYFLQSETKFKQRFHQHCDSAAVNPQLVGQTTEAIRQLDRLREEGLLSEYEFEQQRRRLLEGIKQ